MQDISFMRRCLELAQLGRGKVGNGAMVGAVLVDDGQIIAEGWHRHFGGPHAERDLLDNFVQKISSNYVLYVSLEPCCHSGKTSPCTDRIIERGVKRIVVGMRDPDRRVAGKGITQLRAAGIDVVGPVLQALCERLNRGFVSVRMNHRPWITLKTAVTKDGRTSSKDGKPLKITSKEQDLWSHHFLRAQHDAILVGVDTVTRDNPKLDTRFDREYKSSSNHLPAGEGIVQPYRIILDPHLRMPLTANVVRDEGRNRTIVMTAPASDASVVRTLEKRGVRVHAVPLMGGFFDWQKLWEALLTPNGDFHGVTSILVEGGAKSWQAFRAVGFVDEEVTLVGAH